MPPPCPVAHPVDREEGIARYRALLTPEEYRDRLARGETEGWRPVPHARRAAAGVPGAAEAPRGDGRRRRALRVRAPDGGELPPSTPARMSTWSSRPSTSGLQPGRRPGRPSRYVLGVQREARRPRRLGADAPGVPRGRRVFVSPPRNHFPLDEARRSRC
jgi:hypothetical protein